jgi:hypothetical protein
MKCRIVLAKIYGGERGIRSPDFLPPSTIVYLHSIVIRCPVLNHTEK